MQHFDLTGFEMSKSAKIQYLKQLIGKIYKIMHLIEEKDTTGFSPKQFIAGQIFEVQAANDFFDDCLSIIVIKLKGLYDGCDTMEFSQCKKQVFECRNFLNDLVKKIEDQQDGGHDGSI